MFISYHHTTPTQHRTAYDAPPRWLLAPGIPISPQRCTPAHLMTWAHYSPAAAPRELPRNLLTPHRLRQSRLSF